MERELALDKKLGQTKAVNRDDGSHVARGERLVDQQRTGQLSLKLGLSTDKLQSVVPAERLRPCRIILPSFVALPGIEKELKTCHALVTAFGPTYAAHVGRHASGMCLIAQDPTALLAQIGPKSPDAITKWLSVIDTTKCIILRGPHSAQ